MAKNTCPHKLSRWSIEEIVVSDRLRAGIREDAVVALMGNIREIGLREPPTVRVDHDEDGGEFPILVTGMHRVEALKRLGNSYVDCIEFDGDETEARKWEIAENLHRAELTVQERAEHIAEWVRLTETEAGQVVQPHIRNDGRALNLGIAKAARELPIAGPTEHARRKTVERAVKIDSMKPEAKEAAATAGLADNQSALLTVAKAAPEQQVQAVQEIVQRKARKATDTARLAKIRHGWNR